jgi:hypothetical protein
VIVLGAIFLVLAALATVAAVDTARDVNVHLNGFGVDATTTALWVFCAGAATMLLLLLALAAFRRAARKSRARRRELKQLRSEDAATARDVDLRDSEGEHRAEDVPAHAGPGAYVAGADDGRERRYVADDDARY